jgi:hypothetical protein
VDRRERAEPARGLRELPLATGSVAATGVVPGDGHVDEALEEILLGRVGDAPRVLEGLVRLEVLTLLDQIETSPQQPVHGRSVTLEGDVATILLAGVDLFIRGKLEAVLEGHSFVSIESIEEPDLVIADIARTDPDEVADSYPDVPILGFSNHTDTAGLRRAHEAGFDQVVAKSALTERAPELVGALIDQ